MKKKLVSIGIVTMLSLSAAWSQTWDNKITGLYPADNATRLQNLDSLVITFENTIGELSGSLLIHSEEGEVYESIALTSGKVKKKDNRISIYPERFFREDSSYYITISENAFGEGFKGISDNKTWNFSAYYFLKELIRSDYVNDNFKLFITLPENYDPERETPYPVLYFSDGNYLNDDFAYPGQKGFIKSISEFYKTGNVPEVIIVCIGYPSNQDVTQIRYRDLYMDWDGSCNYLDFMQYELIPHIDSTYNTDDANRFYLGFSVGGRLSLNMALRYSDPANRIFKGMLASDPALFDNGDYGNGKTVFDFEFEHAHTIDSLPVNLLITTGTTQYTNNVTRLNDTLKTRNYKGFKYSVIRYPYASHNEVWYPSYKEALYWFFNMDKTYVQFPVYPREKIYEYMQDINLNDLVDPKGGSFTGEVENDSTFNPSKLGTGKHLVKYHYTDSLNNEIIRGYNFEVLPNPIRISTNNIYFTDSINSIEGSFYIEGLPDSVHVDYSLDEYDFYSEFSNNYFRIEDNRLLVNEPYPKGQSYFNIGVKAVTKQKDTLFGTFPILIRNAGIFLSDKQGLYFNTPAGSYLRKIETNNSIDYSYFLPDTGDYNNEFFRISNDSLFLHKGISNLKQEDLKILIAGQSGTGTPVTKEFTLPVSQPTAYVYIENEKISVFPNPVSHNLSIQVPTGSNDPVNIKMVNLTGKLVLQKDIYGSEIQLNLGELKEGIYILDIRSKNVHSLKRIVKVNP